MAMQRQATRLSAENDKAREDAAKKRAAHEALSRSTAALRQRAEGVRADLSDMQAQYAASQKRKAELMAKLEEGAVRRPSGPRDGATHSPTLCARARRSRSARARAGLWRAPSGSTTCAWGRRTSSSRGRRARVASVEHVHNVSTCFGRPFRPFVAVHAVDRHGRFLLTLRPAMLDPRVSGVVPLALAREDDNRPNVRPFPTDETGRK